MKNLALCLIFTFLGAFCYAQTKTEQAVLDTEKARFEAQVKKDYTALDRLLADDLLYTHSNGNVDGKASYVESIKNGKSVYEAIEPGEMKVRVYGKTAVINGTCKIKISSNGQANNLHLRYTDVYVRNGKQWQLVTWQSLRLPN